jgi:hypothetical protein
MPAATIGPVGDGFVLDGEVGEWTNRTPTLSLIPQGTGARPGTIWLAQSPQGLVVADFLTRNAIHLKRNCAISAC